MSLLKRCSGVRMPSRSRCHQPSGVAGKRRLPRRPPDVVAQRLPLRRHLRALEDRPLVGVGLQRDALVQLEAAGAIGAAAHHDRVAGHDPLDRRLERRRLGRASSPRHRPCRRARRSRRGRPCPGARRSAGSGRRARRRAGPTRAEGRARRGAGGGRTPKMTVAGGWPRALGACRILSKVGSRFASRGTLSRVLRLCPELGHTRCPDADDSSLEVPRWPFRYQEPGRSAAERAQRSPRPHDASRRRRRRCTRCG